MNDTFQNARWLWCEEPVRDPINRYAQLVRRVTLGPPEGDATIAITADQSYQLFVNGRYVGRGPARGYQRSWPYDTHDVSDSVRAGDNTIAVIAHNPGTGTFFYRHEGVAGVLVDARLCGVRTVSDDQWLCRSDPSRATHTPKLSKQMGFQEHADLRRDDRAWLTSGATDGRDGWHPPYSQPCGCPPWHELEERTLPHLTRDVIAYEPDALTASWSSRGRDDRAPSNPFVRHRDAIASASWRSTELATEHDGRTIIDVAPLDEGERAGFTLALRDAGVGELLLEAEGARGGERVDVLYAETLDDDGRPVYANGVSDVGDAVDVCTRLVLAEGASRHNAFQVIGHRFATLVVEGPCPSMRLRVAHRQTRYPLETVGAFECDDEPLNETHRVSVNTQRNCMLDAYVDTPWREQAQWWGDARVQAWNTFSLANDARLLMRGLRQIGDPAQALPNGLTYGHAPTIGHNCVLPDFACVWMLTIWDHYFQTGRPDAFLELAARIDRIIAYFEGFGIAEGELARADPRYWLFLDWTEGIPREGTPTLLNMMLLEALDAVCALVRISGYTGPLERAEQLASTLRHAIEKTLWDPDARAFHDGLDGSGNAHTSASLHSQVQAVLCALRADEHRATAHTAIARYLRDESDDVATPTPFWLVYVYEAARRVGLVDEAIEHMTRFYRPMVETGGTWERCDPPGHGDVTASHAWSAHPVYHLPRMLGGVVQTAPGWRRIRFVPPVANPRCAHVATTLPTPNGPITARWHRADSAAQVHLELPDGVEATAALPGHEERVMTGTTSWNIDL